ncbi:MAG: hypothetical protein Q9173_004182 [Seirophora scorigena]
MAKLNQDNMESEASGAATSPSAPITETVVQKKRGRPPKAQKTTSSIPGSPQPVLDGPQPSLGFLADTPAVSTAIAADTQPLTSPPSQKKNPSSRGEETSAEVLVAVKHAVGCQDIPDEEFVGHLKRTKPNLLADLLSIKHQLQTTFHNHSESPNRHPVSAKPRRSPGNDGA